MQFAAEAVCHTGDVVAYYLMLGGLGSLHAMRFRKTAWVSHIELKQVRDTLHGLRPFGEQDRRIVNTL